MSHSFLCACIGACVLFFNLVTTSKAQGSSPCHGNKDAQGNQVNCSRVILPKDLCSSCKLKPFDKETGAFLNCRSIYDLSVAKCQSSLKRYADLNPCDAIRNTQVEDFSNASNAEGLDYFVYAVCEQCCDCVPRGSTPDDYNLLKKQSKLLRARRGNCPAHAWYDVCQILPKVTYFKAEGTEDRKGFNEACPQLKYWFDNQSNGWFLKGWVPMSDGVENFLKSMYWAAKCTNKETWQKCVALEDAQDRL